MMVRFKREREKIRLRFGYLLGWEDVVDCVWKKIQILRSWTKALDFSSYIFSLGFGDLN